MRKTRNVWSSPMVIREQAEPIPDLFGTGMMQSCHTYNPIQLTHHNCEWARGILTGSEPMPTWPLKDGQGK